MLMIDDRTTSFRKKKGDIFMVRERIDIDSSVDQSAASESGRTGERTPAISRVHGRSKHVSPVALVTKNPREIKVRSDLLTARILSGLLDSKKYTLSAHQMSKHTQILPHSKGTVHMSFSPRSGETREQLLASLFLLGDELVDTFLVLLAVALDCHGAASINLPFPIQVDDILTICQKKKSKGCYSERQRQKVFQQILVLSRASVEATLTTSRGKTWNVKSSLLDIEIAGQPYNSMITQAYERPMQLCLRIGDWATAIPEHQFQIVLLPRQVLQYHAKEQKHEKRLGRYLTLLYRINAYKNEGFVKVSMGVLLEQSGIECNPDHPGRTQEAIESALRQLQSDAVIGTFLPLVEDSYRGREMQKRIQQRAYHWWDDYRQQVWLFAPPDYARAAYQRKPRGVVPDSKAQFPD